MKKIIIISLIICVLLVISSIGYFGFSQYQSYQKKSYAESLAQQAKQKEQDSEVEQLKQEVEVLKNKKPDVVTKTVIEPAKQTAGNDISDIIQKWKQRVVYIDCKFVSQGINLGEQSGSGYIQGISGETGNLSVLTNYHVIKVAIHSTDGTPLGISTPGPTSCDIKLPGDSQFTTAYNIKDSNTFLSFTDRDAAIINVNPTPYMMEAYKNSVKYNLSECTNKAQLGDEILILGYPGIGDQSDVTVTDGIISGYDGDYYITSAKVEHGDSGGAAISVKDNCYLGIPSFVDVGSLESLARVFDYQKLISQ